MYYTGLTKAVVGVGVLERVKKERHQRSYILSHFDFGGLTLAYILISFSAPVIVAQG
jgi:hypothetical protein